MHLRTGICWRPRRVDGLGALKAANALVEEGLVVFAEPDLIQARHWRDGPPDPASAANLDRQWHLKAVGILEAWKDTQGSPAIRIAVLDDGLDANMQSSAERSTRDSLRWRRSSILPLAWRMHRPKHTLTITARHVLG